MDKTIRRVTDLEAQRLEIFRYWQSLPPGERLAAVWEKTRSSYLERGVGIDYWVSDKRIVRRTAVEHAASEEVPWTKPESF